MLSNSSGEKKKENKKYALSLFLLLSADSFFSLPGVKQGRGGAMEEGSGGSQGSSGVPGCRMHLNPSAGCEQTAFALVFGRSRTAGQHSIQLVITV